MIFPSICFLRRRSRYTAALQFLVTVVNVSVILNILNSFFFFFNNRAPRIGVTVKGFGVKEKRSIYYGSFNILFHIHCISGILLVKQSSHLSKAHRYVNKPA